VKTHTLKRVSLHTMNESKFGTINSTLRRAYQVLSITFVILCTAAFLVYKQQGKVLSITTNADKYTNFPVRIEELISSLKDAELGVRGFLYTKDSVFLEPFHTAENRVDSILRIIKKFEKTAVIQEKDVKELTRMSTHILKEQKAYLNTYNQGVNNLKEGKKTMDSLRFFANNIKSVGISSIANLRKQQSKSIEKQPLYLLLIIFIGLSIFAIAAFFILNLIKKLTVAKTELDIKVQEVESYNKELEQYSFTLTHHLQEPLRKLQLFLSRFQQKHTDPLPQEGQTWLKKVGENAEQAQVYLNEFLSYSKLLKEKDKIIEVVDVNTVIKDILTENQDLIRALNAQITVESMPLIVGDTQYIKILWHHLIQNALYYTENGRQPIIAIRNEKPEGDFARMCIQDNGCGFGMEFSEKIFQVFQRLDKNHVTQGLGMGLAICRRITDLHNGRISVKSVEHEGSIFHIYLPLHLPNKTKSN
jgi:signal transduction histidine kinase